MPFTVQETERPHERDSEDQQEKAEKNLRLELQRCPVPALALMDPTTFAKSVEILPEKAK